MRNNLFESQLVKSIVQNGFQLVNGNCQIYLAKKFGFCSGVANSVRIAYQTLERFPNRQIYITNEIIHNPYVNQELKKIGISFLEGRYSDNKYLDNLKEDDVVIIPSFGATIEMINLLKRKRCTVIDTTCPSVLAVWKRIENYIRLGFTPVIYGKKSHEETQATVSRIRNLHSPYIILENLDNANILGDYLVSIGDKERFLSHFEGLCSDSFSPMKDLVRIGVANQTTMLAEESLAIQKVLKESIIRRYSRENLSEHFQSFDTICMATQERQNATLELAKNKLNLMIVVGGFNSSNTIHLAKLARRSFHNLRGVSAPIVPIYHIEDENCIISRETLRHRDTTGKIMESHILLQGSNLKIGITAGASTPNNKIGAVIQKILDIIQK